MILFPGALKENKAKAVKSFKTNSKGPPSKVSFLQQQLIPDAYGKTYSRTTICFYWKLSQAPEVSGSGTFRAKDSLFLLNIP